jgi:hypothetical protein
MEVGDNELNLPVPDIVPPRHAKSTDLKSLGARIGGIIRSPRATFTAVAAHPRWADVLVACLVITFICGALLLATEVGQLALVDQLERMALAFGQRVDDARYVELLDASQHGVLYAAVSALASGPVLVFALALIVYGVFTGLQRGDARFNQVLAIVAHAGVILALRQVVAAPLNYVRETLASPTTLSPMFTMLDEASPLARFFGVIDLFVLWWTVVLALGVATLYRRRARPVILSFVGVYALLAALLALAMAMTGGTA